MHELLKKNIRPNTSTCHAESTFAVLVGGCVLGLQLSVEAVRRPVELVELPEVPELPHSLQIQSVTVSPSVVFTSAHLKPVIPHAPAADVTLAETPSTVAVTLYVYVKHESYRAGHAVSA